MSSYEYHEFRALDRPLTRGQQREVARLSSRAKVNADRAVFVYSYSSFRGDPDTLLTSLFDAMFFIASYGDLQLVFSLPRSRFDPARAEPYLVKELNTEGSGVQARERGDRVLLSIGLEELEFGWVEGEGWLDPLLPLREGLLAGDDRPLYLFWLAAFEHGLLWGEDEEELSEPPIPPGMGELGEEHRSFARAFDISDGALAAAVAKSPPRAEVTEEHLFKAIDALDEHRRKDLLLRVGRGEHVDVRRELQAAARALLLGETDRPTGRTLKELERVAEARGQELERQAQEARLDEIESKRAEIWGEIVSRLSSKGARYKEPVELLSQLHELARERGGLRAFRKRLEDLDQYDKSKAFMRRLREAGIIED